MASGTRPPADLTRELLPPPAGKAWRRAACRAPRSFLLCAEHVCLVPTRFRGSICFAARSGGRIGFPRARSLTLRSAAPPARTPNNTPVEAPRIDFTKCKLALPVEIIEQGLLSNLQLESILYSNYRHSLDLPNKKRSGFLLGDGAGIGVHPLARAHGAHARTRARAARARVPRALTPCGDGICSLWPCSRQRPTDRRPDS